MTLLQCIAQGAGIAIGFSLVNGLGQAISTILMGRVARTRTRGLSVRGDCPLPCCEIKPFPPVE